MEIKICKTCKIPQPISNYDKALSCKLGVLSHCKDCRTRSRGSKIGPIKEMEGEIWVDIIGWEGYYKISDKVRIKRLPRRYKDVTGRNQNLREKILKTYICTTTGYQMVDLSRNADFNRLRTTMHRILAIAFIPNPENKPEVNHKNGIKHDNRIKNLEWATSSEQKIHAFRVLGRRPPTSMLGKKGALNPNSIPVKQINLTTGAVINTFSSIKDAVDSKNATEATCVSDCCKGKYKKHNGFKWEYA